MQQLGALGFLFVDETKMRGAAHVVGQPGASDGIGVKPTDFTKVSPVS
jgi:hypothetical protein